MNHGLTVPWIPKGGLDVTENHTLKWDGTKQHESDRLLVFFWFISLNMEREAIWKVPRFLCGKPHRIIPKVKFFQHVNEGWV